MILINASTKETLRLLQDFVPIHPPVAVGYLHSYAKSKGIRVKSIDQELVHDVPALVQEYVEDLPRPYLCGFSLMTAGFKIAVETSKILKTMYPDCFQRINAG